MTNQPVRIQLSRRKGWRLPPDTVVVARPTRWGNPFRVTEERTAAECVMAFGTWLRCESAHAGMPVQKQWILDHMPELRGKNLACWCRVGSPCHADVLLEMANDLTGSETATRYDGRPYRLRHQETKP